MGGEIGQIREWSHDGEIDWELLQNPRHAGLQRLIGDINRLYAQLPALHREDAEPSGFSWVIGNDADNNVYAYERRAAGELPLLVIVNMTPVSRNNYRVGASRGRPLARTTQHRCGNLWRQQCWQRWRGARPAFCRPWTRAIA